jgi:peptide/nickel transport system substrate-binding protein
MLLALGKIGTSCCFVMPARIAASDPFTQIRDHRQRADAIRDQRMGASAKAVFEKFPGYVPPQEPASWLAGGKRIVADRIEGIIIANLATRNIVISPRGVRAQTVELLPLCWRDERSIRFWRRRT